MILPLCISFLGAICVGTSDFLSRLVSKNHSPLYTVLWCTGMGTVLFGGLLSLKGYDFTTEPLWIWEITFYAGMFHLAGLLSFYHALMRGPLKIASPLCSLSVLILAIEWHFLGLHLSLQAYSGIGLVMIGIWILAYFSKTQQQDYTPRHILITAAYALFAACCFATRFLLLQYYREDIEIMVGLFQSRTFAFIGALLIIGGLIVKDRLFSQKQRTHAPFNMMQNITLPFVQSFLENTGIALVLWISIGDYRVIGPAIFGCYSLVTLFWGRVFFKESLSKEILTGISVMLIGLVVMQLA